MRGVESEQMNVQKQVEYWRNGSEEDMEAAGILFGTGKRRHALYFAHLALEKMLKALVAQMTADVPPRMHDLLRLAEVGKVGVSQEQRAFLARFQQYCLEGRYPGSEASVPSVGEAEADLRTAQEMLAWLRNLLS